MMKRKYIIALFLLISIALIFMLQPKVSSLLFSKKREVLLHNFEKSVLEDKKISIKKYWEFREFYSPGIFIYDPSGSEIEKLRPFPNYAKYLDSSLDLTPILFFEAPNLTSLGGITKQTGLPKVEISNIENVYLNTNDTFFFKTKDNKTVLLMIKTIKEVATANGFILKNENIINSGKMWFEIAVIE